MRADRRDAHRRDASSPRIDLGALCAAAQGTDESRDLGGVETVEAGVRVDVGLVADRVHESSGELPERSEEVADSGL